MVGVFFSTREQRHNAHITLTLSNHQRFNESFIDIANTVSDLSCLFGIFNRFCDDTTNDPSCLRKRLLFRKGTQFQNN